MMRRCRNCADSMYSGYRCSKHMCGTRPEYTCKCWALAVPHNWRGYIYSFFRRMAGIVEEIILREGEGRWQ